MESNSATIRTRAPATGQRPTVVRRGWSDWLLLALAGIWVLDGLLQYQPFMFTADFAKTLADTAQGNPGVVAHPITWAAGIVEANPVWTNAVFATIQLLLGVGVALLSTTRLALAGSVVWSVAVWWFGEGLGGVLGGTAHPLSGASGAVILYGLLAVMLWPTNHRAAGWTAVADRAVGRQVARLLWLVLWGSLTYFTVLPGNRDVHGVIASMADGQPRWLVAIDDVAAAATDGRGLIVSIVLAALFAVVALGILAPAGYDGHPGPRDRARRPDLGGGEALGSLFSGQATDLNSGPLLALLALAYWPLRASGDVHPRTDSGGKGIVMSAMMTGRPGWQRLRRADARGRRSTPRPRVVAARSLRRATRYDVDIAHVPMGVAMAAMFAELDFLPWWLWGIVFAALTGYFVVRTVIAAGRRTIWTDHYLPHTVHAGAMLYMVLAAPAALSTTGMAGTAMTAMGSGAGFGTHLPTIASVLALFMAGYTVVLPIPCLDRWR